MEESKERKTGRLVAKGYVCWKSAGKFMGKKSVRNKKKSQGPLC